MRKLVNPGNYPQQSFESCDDKSPLRTPENIDQPLPNCPPIPPEESQHDIPDRHKLFGLADKNGLEKTGIGVALTCDPMQTGQIVNDPNNPNRTTIYRYSQALRGCDEAMMDLFTNVVVINDEGEYFPVPIIYATQERAVAYILQDNMRKDNSGVVDRIRLPIMSLYSSGIAFDINRYTYHKAIDYGRGMRADFKPGYTVKECYERDTVFGFAKGIPVNVTYNLYVWTMYVEDMNQIVEQIITKFSPMAYIRVRGINLEVGVKLDSIANNLNVEPGDKANRVVKYQFNFTAEAYIPQPIERKKAVLKTKIDVFNKVDEEKITEVLDRLEEAVGDLDDD